MGVASHAGGLLCAPFQIAAPAFARRGDDHRDALRNPPACYAIEHLTLSEVGF
jgi:hypothetical protein